MSHAKWWKDTEDKLCKGREDHFLLVVLVFYDGSNLDKYGNENVYPVLLTLGNFPLAYIKGPRGKDLIGYVPPLEATKEESGTEQARAARVTVLHDCLKTFLGTSLSVRFLNHAPLDEAKEWTIH